MGLSRFIQGNEILRHLFRPDGQAYAWFRTKELILHLCAQAGAFLFLFLFISLGVWIVCFTLIAFGVWAGLLVVGDVVHLCSFLGTLVGLPLSILWFRRLVKQEEEAEKVTRDLLLMQRYNDYPNNEQTWDTMAEAFAIFSKYKSPTFKSVTVKDDLMLTGPSPAEVSDEDKERLKVIGWLPLERWNCFYSYM